MITESAIRFFQLSERRIHKLNMQNDANRRFIQTMKRHEKKESFCPTLFLIIELQIWRIDLFQGWLSHPLFLVGLGSSLFPLPDKHWCYSQRQVNHWSQKFVRPTSLCYRLLAPLEIRIWFGQTDWYSDLIATSVVGYIICSGQANATHDKSTSVMESEHWGNWPLVQSAFRFHGLKDTLLHCKVSFLKVGL